MITDVFKNAFRLKAQRGWSKVFIVIDLHGTIITPEYNKNNTGAKTYEHAEDVLRYWTKRNDLVLILWTSSYLSNCQDILAELFLKGVNFDYFNENPMEKSNGLSDFSSKFYFNVLLDDKAGFDPDKDWLRLKKYFKL